MAEKSLFIHTADSFQQVAHHLYIECIFLCGETVPFRIEVKEAGIQQHAGHGICHFLYAVALHHAFHLGEVVNLAHGSVLRFVKLVFGEQGRKLPLAVSTAYFPAFILKAHLHLFHVKQFLIHIPSGIKIKEIFVVARFEAML